MISYGKLCVDFSGETKLKPRKIPWSSTAPHRLIDHGDKAPTKLFYRERFGGNDRPDNGICSVCVCYFKRKSVKFLLSVSPSKEMRDHTRQRKKK